MTAQNLRIVIAGGNGQLGRILARHFHDGSHTVTVIARHAVSLPWRTAVWDGQQPGPWVRELDGANILINLAGRSVNCRYSGAHRDEIKRSRVQTTQLLARAIAESANPPALLINASTATIYRHSPDRDMDEVTGQLGGKEKGIPSTWRFSVDVAQAWEDALFERQLPSTRRIALRSAMVMSPDPGGVFDMLLKLVRCGLGGTAGSGSQYVSWIHYVDFIAAIEFLIDHPDMAGAVNVSAPHPLPNSEFMSLLRHAWGMPIGLPASAWMLEIGAILLRTETELILKSRRVVPGRLLDEGFKFKFPDWKPAAENLVRSWREDR